MDNELNINLNACTFDSEPLAKEMDTVNDYSTLSYMQGFKIKHSREKWMFTKEKAIIYINGS